MGRKSLYGHENDEEIERLYVQEKISMHALSIKFKIPLMTIKRRLVAAGVAIRGISSAMTLHHLHKRAKESNQEEAQPKGRALGVPFDDDSGKNEEWLN